jgi:hypothetical protein
VVRHQASDLRFSLRALRSQPGFAATVVLTLALAIGANTAVFSVVYAVLLRPLPFRESGRLVELWRKTDTGNTKERVAPAVVDEVEKLGGVFIRADYARNQQGFP